MPKRGRRRKKTRTHTTDVGDGGTQLSPNETKIPKSLVIRRGKCESLVTELVQDVRNVMMPYTAINFQEDAKFRKLTIQKYCQHVCLPLGISHMISFSQNQEKLTMRIAKTPQGPTLTFRVHQFSLSKHIQQLQKRPIKNRNMLTSHPPIVVTNNFGDVSAPPQVKLMRITFQNMFPAINVATIQLKQCRRVVLFHYIVDEDDSNEDDDNKGSNDEDDTQSKKKKKKNTKDDVKQQQQQQQQQQRKRRERVEIRHYAIKATPVGVNRKVRRLIQTKLPNLNKVQDIADYISGKTTAATQAAGDASDSEPEDGANAVVQLAHDYTGRGNNSQSKSALKLVELGPRLCLELNKVEQGLGDGDVMYHAHISKTPDEIKAMKQTEEQRIKLKQQRRQQQEQNVERKRKAQEEKREAKRKRKEERELAAMEELRHGGEEFSDDDDDDDNDDHDRNNEESDEDDDRAEEESEDDDDENSEAGSDHDED